MSHIVDIIAEEELETLLAKNQDKLVVLFFTADWCPYCRAVAPKVNSLSNTYLDVLFVRVDIDEAQPLAKAYSIRTIPTFKFIRYSDSTKTSEVVETLKGSSPTALEVAVIRNNEKSSSDDETTIIPEVEVKIIISGEKGEIIEEWGQSTIAKEVVKRTWAYRAGQAVLIGLAFGAGKVAYGYFLRSLV